MTEQFTDWHGCYDGGWGNLIVNEAYAHPAKYRPGLIDRIYKHGFERGWWAKGDCIGDPFGGIGGGGIMAAFKGLRWRGVELEDRFVELARLNFAKHKASWLNGCDPLPEIVQGDSREFAKLVACSSIVTSPPYADTAQGTSGSMQVMFEKMHADEGNAGKAWHRPNVAKKKYGCHNDEYGKTPGQIGNLKAIVTSPPYADSVKGDHGEAETAKESRDKRETAGGSLGQSQRNGGYGATEGNIGNLKAVVTSPPYSEGGGHRSNQADRDIERGKGISTPCDNYGDTPGNIGNDKSDDYWSAMRDVYDQCRQAIQPGGVLVVVVKDYVKAGKRVTLCDQTLRLLESLGFVLVERIRAWVTTTTVHDGLFGDVEEKVERKSFFRRLAEKNGSPPIDWEEVIVVRLDA